MTLGPGWVDEYAAALKSGDEGKAREITGQRPFFGFRIDSARRKASQSKGGKKGSKTRAQRARNRVV